MSGRLVLTIPAAGDLSWQRDLDRPPACRGSDPKLFEAQDRGRISPDTWARVDVARDICLGCPVRADCLMFAMIPDNRVEGVWGGEYFPAPGVRRRLDRNGLRIPLTRPKRVTSAA
jgi:hypothetical protein